VDQPRPAADNPHPGCEHGVNHVRLSTHPPTAPVRSPTAVAQRASPVDLPRRHLSTGSTAPMTMTRLHLYQGAPTTRARPPSPPTASPQPRPTGSSSWSPAGRNWPLDGVAAQVEWSLSQPAAPELTTRPGGSPGWVVSSARGHHVLRVLHRPPRRLSPGCWGVCGV